MNNPPPKSKGAATVYISRSSDEKVQRGLQMLTVLRDFAESGVLSDEAPVVSRVDSLLGSAPEARIVGELLVRAQSHRAEGTFVNYQRAVTNFLRYADWANARENFFISTPSYGDPRFGSPWSSTCGLFLLPAWGVRVFVMRVSLY